MTTTSTHQISLPGQAYVADGPHDHTGMYLMHFGLRRDLATITSAVSHTPLGAEDTWSALHARWRLFAEILHHHHSAEDDHYWPVLVAAVSSRGTEADRVLIAAMAGEHAAIDPALDAVEEAFGALRAHPCDAHRNALDLRVSALCEAIGDHLAHEEREALPLVQRVMTTEQYATVEKAVERAYPVRMVPTLIPWVCHRLPEPALEAMLTSAGRPYRLLRQLMAGRFERRELKAFRYSETVLPT
jgi:hypothetical protein